MNADVVFAAVVIVRGAMTVTLSALVILSY